jgi:hypothetical protein
MQDRIYNRLITENQLPTYLGISVSEASNLGPMPEGASVLIAIFNYCIVLVGGVKDVSFSISDVSH